MAKYPVIRFVTILMLLALLIAPAVQPAAAVTLSYPDRLSLSTAGTEGNATSWKQSISGNGHLVAFESAATTLVSGDTNDSTDIFVRDTWAGTTSRVSVSSAGEQANGGSFSPVISYDGGFIVFSSSATNLVSGDTNGCEDVFVRSTVANTTTRISVASNGTQGNDNAGGYGGFAISEDGTLIAFTSSATNLVDGDTNGMSDVFVRNILTRTTTRISVTSAGVQGSGGSGVGGISMSKDGRYVVFSSDFTNLVTGDTNAKSDIFLRDIQTSTTTRISLTSSAAQANGDSYSPSIAPNGDFVAFASDATNLVTGDTNVKTDIFVRDRVHSTTARSSVSNTGVQSNDISSFPVISSDGQYIAFQSLATNLVTGDTNAKYDIFVRDTTCGKTSRVSVNSLDQQADGESYLPSITSEGEKGFVVFSSLATNLVDGDGNDQIDVFQVETPWKCSTNTYSYISGLVRDGAGYPIKGAIVSNGSGETVITDALGGYFFYLIGVPGGTTYSISATHPDYLSFTGPIEVTIPPTQGDVNITGTPKPPSAPTLSSPADGSTLTTYAPEFSWSDERVATNFKLWLGKPDGTQTFAQWYTRTSANCDGISCSVQPDTFINPGENRWCVKAFNVSGAAWSTCFNFNSPGPAASAVLVSPIGGSSADSFYPTLTWNEVAATQYKLVIYSSTGVQEWANWYTRSQANCNGSTCWVVPDVAMSKGTHTWYIKSYNPEGGAWSSDGKFTTPTAPAGTPVLIVPSGSVSTPNPTFTWTGDAKATYYKLWVGKPDGTLVFAQWYTPVQTNCKAATGCSISPTLNLGWGNYKWYIKSYNPNGGAWSSELYFTVQ